MAGEHLQTEDRGPSGAVDSSDGSACALTGVRIEQPPGRGGRRKYAHEAAAEFARLLRLVEAWTESTEPQSWEWTPRARADVRRRLDELRESFA